MRPFDIKPLAPILTLREAAPRRTKIWEFNTNLHCSIIGTCLSTTELRQVLRKLGMAPPDSTDHELHGIAVTLAGRHDEPARRLHKALDANHKLAVSQFAKASTEADVRALWRGAVKRGDIPGAYWATLTHEATGQSLIREAFGEVHMLSHLVGSANRADIKRLCVLEAERSELAERLDQLQAAMHEAITARDARINQLQAELEAQCPAARTEADPDLRTQIADLERRLAAETARRCHLEEKLAAAQENAAADRDARLAADETAQAMRRELQAVEESLTPVMDETAPPIALGGAAVLYVGGRPNQVAQMRAVVGRFGGTLLSHDGGVENHASLLPGLISRAELVLFPVDCISHEAANAVKALCRQVGKRFVPLRSASLTALVAGLHDWMATGVAEAAE
ncbi:MAG TPA: DUF2325 domain-containing protein [Rhodopila sp.]|uniref:DUF2325 domain-containing protein n=1 Tax=Rhodopila sp. TaxID=2480087 RepID=UPI002BC5CBA1|nr:DUF2325 domain-containing protein [Rhodopila sp.]HVY13817.1 DUF2325 domain-containing protein [Rhodopila sp.]